MDPSPPGRASNAGLAVVGMLLGVFVLIAAASLAAVSLTGSSGPAPNGPPKARPPGRAPDALDARLADHGWQRRSPRSVALEGEDCVPVGWNTGATSRSETVHEHYTGQREDGEAVIALTVYSSEAEAAADLQRARSDAWVECRRDDLQQESDAGTTAALRTLAADPRAPGVAYSYRYVEDGELDTGTIQYVAVGHIRATVTCRCTSLGRLGRQLVARDVAAGLAALQDMPAP
jgi:hypothetical protein